MENHAARHAQLIDETHFAPAGRDSRKDLVKQAQETLANPIIQALLESIQGYLLILNEDRQILAANPELLEALGNEDPDWLLGLRPGESLNCAHFTEGPDGCGTSRECRSCGAVMAILECQKKGCAAVGECTIAVRCGDKIETRDFQVRATPLKSRHHKLTVFSILDISARKRREILEDIFLHDLLNSLGSLEGLAQIRDQANPQAAARQFLSITDHLKDEVRYHRSLLEAEKGTLKPANAPIASSEILIELEELLRCHPLTGPRTIRFKESAKGHHFLDRVLLLRVLLNMSLNAAEASAANDPITVAYESDEIRGTFSVHNRGFIPESIAERIFTRSFTTKSESGHGLGTYGIKLLGEQYLGGEVSFSTHPVDGTAFRIRLPLTEAGQSSSRKSAPGRQANELPDEAILGQEEISRALHILFIDDKEPLARLGKLFLERRGYKVTTRIDSQEGLELFEKHPDTFGLVITDMTMPKLNGLDLARRIHALSPQTPIILCTGHGDIFSEAAIKAAGIKAIVAKPLTSIELSRTIHRVRSNSARQF